MKKKCSAQQVDSVNLSKEIRLRELIPLDETIKYSAQVQKFNENNKSQHRIFLLTDKALYNIIKKENIIKSLMSKLVNLKTTFSIRRRIKLELIYGITMSKQKTSEEFIAHVNGEHDYRYRTSRKLPIIKALVDAYIKCTKKKIGFYFRDDITLVDYCTTKIHLKDKMCLRPKGEPIMLDVAGVEYYEMPKIKFELVYSFDGQQVPIQKFQQHKGYQLNPEINYYTITTIDKSFEELLPYFEHKQCHFVSLPHFCYVTKDKTHLLRPFMLGGKLTGLLHDHGPFSAQLTKFYVTQMILALEFFHSRGFLYRTLSLDKIYLKDNGYICLEGLEKGIIKKPENKLLYATIGLPSHMAPEVVCCQGYSYEADIWSLGVCIYLMLNGNNLFHSSNMKNSVHNTMYIDIVCLQNVPKFIHRMFKRNPKERITLDQLKQDQWFADVNWQSIALQTFKPVHRPELKSVKDWSGKMPSLVYLLK